MARLILPRLLSDGCVIQRRKSIHIWGWDDAGSEITVNLAGETVTGKCNDKGRFDVYLSAKESGGPYELVVSDDKGESITVKDVMLGIVWLCTGQSNMELPINRVKDKYPELIDVEENKRISTFKIVEETSFSGPYEEHNTGSWKHVSKDTILDFSATAYFFASKLQNMTGQPVGLINASLGGSRASSWMSREMLEGYDELIAETDKYNDAAFRKERMEYNVAKDEKWTSELAAADAGIEGHWDKEDVYDSYWDTMTLPAMFTGTPLEGHIGSVWFRRKFDLPKELAGKKARFFFGTMVDSDKVYVNGQLIGETGYQYPPRKYDIPEGLTREKDNVISIRLTIELGLGRVTPGPGKEYKIFNEEASVNLDGEWKYRIGAKCEPKPPTDFINWNSSGLFNGMTAPCHNFPIDGVIWYQGESNVHEKWDYADLTERMVKGYRDLWNEENLPFIAVQLPNFVIDLDEKENWGEFRLIQNKILSIPSTGLAVTMGLGEDNDLHPVTKKPVGERLALWAAHIKYGYNGEYTGPVALAAATNGDSVKVVLGHTDGLCVVDAGKGTEIKDFFLEDEDGKLHETEAVIEDNAIICSCKDEHKAKFRKVLWCCENTYRGGLVSNVSGIPMSPFKLLIN
ncbi:MAG: hypothetical protein IKQ00_11080 [Butyrivibrio sp.]|nr:hypothetical protein [Butyrivibrio sp.]MBR4670265.1 hypothetical protein [Butyrivibrio sp.]